MPTIQQLPSASQAGSTDELPVSQGGVTRSVTVADLLASTQPAITMASNTMLGRASLGPGGPETVAIGAGLGLSAGSLSATGGDHAGFAVQGALTLTDQVVLNSSGVPTRMGLPLLRGLFSAGSNVAIDGNGVVSASTDPSVAASLAATGTQASQAATLATSLAGALGGVLNAQGQISGTVVGNVSAASVTAPGGVARSVSGRAGDVVNVRDYGADNSGATDCSAAFAAAYAAAVAGSAAIHVPRGTYRLDSALSWSPAQPLTLFGAGRHASVLAPTHSGVALTITQSDPTQGVEVRDLGFRASGGSATACALAIRCSATTAPGIGTPADAAQVNGISIVSAATTTSGSYPNTFTVGLTLSGLVHAGVREVEWSNPTPGLAGTGCVQAGQCRDLTLTGLRAQNGAFGVQLTDYCAGLRLRDCTFIGTMVGLRTDGVPAASQVGGANAADLSISGGSWSCATTAVLAASVAGLRLQGANLAVAQGGNGPVASVSGGSAVVVAGCSLTGGGSGVGLSVTGAAGGAVSGNGFTGLATAVVLGSGTTGLSVSGNHGDDTTSVTTSFADNSGNSANQVLWQRHNGVLLSNGTSLTLSTPTMGSSFGIQTDGTAPLLLGGGGKGVTLGGAGELAQLAFAASWLQAFAYASLPAAASYPQSLCWCSNARVGSQTAGNGTGALVMASGGGWWMLSGAAVLV